MGTVGPNVVYYSMEVGSDAAAAEVLDWAGG